MAAVLVGPTGFSGTDPLTGVGNVFDKQMGYLKDTRGSNGASTLVNDALKKYFTHAIILDDVPGNHQIDVAFSYGGDLRADTHIDQRGLYLWTAQMHGGAVSQGVSDGDYGGTALAHELMHLSIHPGAISGWNDEHETNSVGGTALMGNPAPLSCTEAGVKITDLNQGEIDVAGNPSLWP